MRLAAVLALLLIALHVAVGDGYGYFRDELYYLACADHLSWGYVEHPPLSIVLLAGWRGVFGDSIFALRLLPAIAGAAALWLTLLITRRLGGGTFAQLLAGIAFIGAPIYLAMHGFYSMNALDILFWTLAQYQVLRLLQSQDAPLREWLLLGLVLGLGLLNKISILWLGAGLAAGIVLTAQRRWLRLPGPYMAAAVALALFSPYVIWQWLHDFPLLEFMRNASEHKYVAQSPWQFLQGVALMLNPAAAPLWIAGVAWTLFAREGMRYRLLGIAWLAVLLILLLNGTSKPEYFSPMQPFFLAAGAMVVERALAGRRRALRIGYALIVLAVAAVAAPIVLPVLPVERFIAYSRALGVQPPTTERKELGPLPQHYADRFGWPELAEAVAQVYLSLPEAERAHVLILARNYGEAGAIDFFGRRWGLPPARSQHNNYFLWGYGDWDGSTAIVLRRNPEELAAEFASVEKAGEFSHPYAMPYESPLPIYICRGFKGSISQAWAAGRHFQ